MIGFDDFLVSLRPGEPSALENLTLVPLFGHPSGPPVITLAEAIRKGGVDVTEVDRVGQVEKVRVRNRTITPLLLFDGEQLVGGKQDRAINKTVLVEAGATLLVPVACVEKGRWRGEDPSFTSSGWSLTPSMRRSNAATLTSTLVRSGTIDVGQMRVWDDVGGYTARLNVSSDTLALSDAWQSIEGDVEEYVRFLRPLPGQSGVAAYVNGEFCSLDAFGRTEAYAALHDTILRACAAEALDRTDAEPSRELRSTSAILSDLHSAIRRPFPTPGMGIDVRLAARAVCGAALLAEGGVVHLSAFPA